jgi:hypothetical protein
MVGEKENTRLIPSQADVAESRRLVSEVRQHKPGDQLATNGSTNRHSPQHR